VQGDLAKHTTISKMKAIYGHICRAHLITPHLKSTCNPYSIAKSRNSFVVDTYANHSWGAWLWLSHCTTRRGVDHSALRQPLQNIINGDIGRCTHKQLQISCHCLYSPQSRGLQHNYDNRHETKLHKRWTAKYHWLPVESALPQLLSCLFKYNVIIARLYM
jgi:hypothetical protein